MHTRRQHILRHLVDFYVDQACPVGSQPLAQALGVSSATIRNDMAILEAEGYLVQPHTSAGRIPTEKAYLYYLQHFVRPGPVETHDRLKKVVRSAPTSQKAGKQLAKELGEMTGEMVIVAIGNDWRYVTGVANLLRKPDFSETGQLESLCELIDACDGVIDQMLESLPNQPTVLIGSNNPFGDDMSSILVGYHFPGERVGMIGIVGPIRMHYARNLALLEYAKELLDTTL